MPGNWYTLWETQSRGLTSTDAAARFVTMFWSADKAWKWADESQGLFTVANGPSLYRVRKSVAGGLWVFEWLSRGI